MLVTARTSNATNPRDGLSLLMVDIRKSLGSGLTIRPIPTQLNVPSSQVFFDAMWVPKENLIGEIDQASKYISWGTYVQQVFISAGCIGTLLRPSSVAFCHMFLQATLGGFSVRH